MYHSMGLDYPKFFKMDLLSRTGFLAAEMVLSQRGLRNQDPKEDCAVVLVNSTSSTADDAEFQKGLVPDSYFPSPSLFVYTLSNIVCGEIAIRNKILGETSFYVQPAFSPEFMVECAGWTFADPSISRILLGWVECLEPGSECVMMLVERDAEDGTPFTADEIKKMLTNR